MTVWLVESEDGLRRSWMRDCTEAEAELIREKLSRADEWGPQMVTKRSIAERDVDRVAHEVHCREADVLGLPHPQPPEKAR